MNGIQIATSILMLVAGVGIFLIACTMMSSNLEALGSTKLKTLFSKTSKSKLAGVGVGAVTTAAVQSSSATSVMVIGFVNAGIMTLAQAATVIFGANIGTTVTGQLVAFGMFGENTISASVIFSATAGIGAFILAFAKSDKLKKIGGITAGFGMLFVGLTLMSDAMKDFSGLAEVREFLATFRNPFLLVLVGAILTALVQSSSVMTSMTITMVVTGLINLNQGIYITMGANVGTCITALIAGLTSTRNAKRTALIHLIFNVSGTAIFMLVGLFLYLGGINYGSLFGKMFPHAPQIQLAMFHTIFNVATVAAVLPLTNLLVKLVTKIIPDKKEKTDSSPRFKYLEEHMLAAPPIAVGQVKNEILRMAELADANFKIACDGICGADEDGGKQFRDNEATLDFLHRELNRYIAELLKADLGENDKIYLSSAIRSASDLERVGDYAENITEYAAKLKEVGEAFSESAVNEIRELESMVRCLYVNAIKAYRDGDIDAMNGALRIEDDVDAFTERMADNHVARLQRGECTPEVGAQYISLAANIERIADHYINVAKTIRRGA